MCEHLATLLKRFLGPGVGPESQRSCQAPWWFWWSMRHPGNSTSLWHIFSLRWYKRGQLTTRWFPGWVWWCQGHWCPQPPPEVGLQTALWSHRSHCPPGGESPALWVLWPGERGKGERPYRTALDEGSPSPLFFLARGGTAESYLKLEVGVSQARSHLHCPLWHEGGSGDVLVAQWSGGWRGSRQRSQGQVSMTDVFAMAAAKTTHSSADPVPWWKWTRLSAAGTPSLLRPSSVCRLPLSCLSVSTSVGHTSWKSREKTPKGPQVPLPSPASPPNTRIKKAGNNRSSPSPASSRHILTVALPKFSGWEWVEQRTSGERLSKGSKFCSPRTQCGGLPLKKGYFIKPFSSLRSPSSFSP